MAALIMPHRLLSRRLLFCAPAQCRLYTHSRFPNRAIGFGRNSRGDNIASHRPYPPSEDRPRSSSEYEHVDNSQFLGQNTGSTANFQTGLKRLLLNNDELIITRQLEMLNIFIGFEQSNRYVMTNPVGDVLGYIVEEPRGLLSLFARQMFRTHRPFRALVMDAGGSPILWIRRPFSWINSRMFIQRSSSDDLVSGPERELVLDTFAEVQQEWHLWRRRYNLFLRSTSHRILPLLESDLQTLTTTREAHFNQFARIDEGLWAWHFILRDAHGQGIAAVNRAYRGLGREIFTDTGQYTVSFRAPDEEICTPNEIGGQVSHKPNAVKNLSVDERALVLAMAVDIDYDYFSRHSEGGHGFGFWWSSGE